MCISFFISAFQIIYSDNWTILLGCYFLLTDMQEFFSAIILLTVLSCLVSEFFSMIVFCFKWGVFAYRSFRYIQSYLSMGFFALIVKYFLLAWFLTWQINFPIYLEFSESCKQRVLFEGFPPIWCSSLILSNASHRFKMLYPLYFHFQKLLSWLPGYAIPVSYLLILIPILHGYNAIRWPDLFLFL